MSRKSRRLKASSQGDDRLLWIVAACSLATATLPLIFFEPSYKVAIRSNLSPRDEKAISNAQVLQKLYKLTKLPEREKPRLLTISDAAQLALDSFFAKAKDLDVFVYYPENGLKILYRPSENKIINRYP